jgi:hypothetical protein
VILVAKRVPSKLPAIPRRVSGERETQGEVHSVRSSTRGPFVRIEPVLGIRTGIRIRGYGLPGGLRCMTETAGFSRPRMESNLTTVSVLVSAAAPLAALFAAVAYDRHRRARTERPPQKEKLLRPPGHSLHARIDEAIDGLLNRLMWACCCSSMAGAFGITTATLLGSRGVSVWLLLFLVPGIAFLAGAVVASLLTFKQVRAIQNIRLGLRGEQAVAEALNEAAPSGFRFFHDFPAGDDWNIDHVAVGTRGVFVIETKARRRRGKSDDLAENEATYDGECLQFPKWAERKPIIQARRNAEWLAEFLSTRCTASIRVQPVLALPGWMVKSKGNYPVKVMGAGYLPTLLRGYRETIAPEDVAIICQLLDDKCRTVEF